MMAIMAVHIKTDGAGIPRSAHLSRTPKGSPTQQSLLSYTESASMRSCATTLPSIISPIRNHNLVTRIFSSTTSSSCTYIGLGAVAVAFDGLPDHRVPAPNKDHRRTDPMPSTASYHRTSNRLRSATHIISRHPVFALTTNFPLICITLRNNLQTIIPGILGIQLKRWQCTLLAAVPPYVCAYLYRDVDSLAGITGGYAGVFIQLIIPAMLAILARRWEAEHPSAGINMHRSWFT